METDDVGMVLQECTKHSLVLADELGKGTEVRVALRIMLPSFSCSTFGIRLAPMAWHSKKLAPMAQAAGTVDARVMACIGLNYKAVRPELGMGWDL
eukprot:scaffold35979_cov18-Tisochrysis_lutea.AAC.3